MDDSTNDKLRRALERWVSQRRLQKDAAAELGISACYLRDLLVGSRRISDEIAGKLGYKRETRLVRFTHDKESV